MRRRRCRRWACRQCWSRGWRRRWRVCRLRCMCWRWRPSWRRQRFGDGVGASVSAGLEAGVGDGAGAGVGAGVDAGDRGGASARIGELVGEGVGELIYMPHNAERRDVNEIVPPPVPLSGRSWSRQNQSRATGIPKCSVLTICWCILSAPMGRTNRAPPRNHDSFCVHSAGPGSSLYFPASQS